jgi:hypothetical protein
MGTDQNRPDNEHKMICDGGAAAATARGSRCR